MPHSVSDTKACQSVQYQHDQAIGAEHALAESVQTAQHMVAINTSLAVWVCLHITAPGTAPHATTGSRECCTSMLPGPAATDGSSAGGS
jgi:hypothetical protein